MNKPVVLDSNYSTTRSLYRTDPGTATVELKASRESRDKFKAQLFLPVGENRQGEGGLRKQGCFKKSCTSKPVITVVTVVFNGEQFLEETILSVINQTYDRVEYIIIDGSSADGTLDIIRKYEHAIDYWVSEKDDGIYDAMNKGIDLATGYWINFMNAGDQLAEYKTIQNIPFKENINSPLIYGNKIQNGKVIYPVSEKTLEYGEIMACHQSVFFNITPSYKGCISYDAAYKIYGDYELINRLYLSFGSFIYVNQSISIFQGNGVSSVISAKKRKEKYKALVKSYGVFGVLRGLWFRLLKCNMRLL